MSSLEITIAATDGGEFMGYLVVPVGGSGPGVVVIQENFGINTVLRDITDSLAAESYVALWPDLFWHQEPGVQLTDQTEEEWARAFELFNDFDLDKGVEDLRAAIEQFRGLEESTGEVDAVSFCSGGASRFWQQTVPVWKHRLAIMV